MELTKYRPLTVVSTTGHCHPLQPGPLPLLTALQPGSLCS